MTAERALLICNDVEAGRAIGRAFLARGLAPPAWCMIPDGAAWSDASGFDILIVAGREPGLLRVAEAAGLPVLIVGELEDESSGQAMVIAPGPAAGEAVAERLIDLFGISPTLLPTYENRLRVLGRELDQRGYASVSITETPDGLSAQPRGSGLEDPAPLELRNDEFRRRVRGSLGARGERPWERPRSRLAPGGHERLLRALGRDLDRRGAIQVQIVALARSVAVTGLRAVSPYDTAEPFQELLGENDLRDLPRRAGLDRRQPDDWLSRLARRLAGLSRSID